MHKNQVFEPRATCQDSPSLDATHLGLAPPSSRVSSFSFFVFNIALNHLESPDIFISKQLCRFHDDSKGDENSSQSDLEFFKISPSET